MCSQVQTGKYPTFHVYGSTDRQSAGVSSRGGAAGSAQRQRQVLPSQPYVYEYSRMCLSVKAAVLQPSPRLTSSTSRVIYNQTVEDDASCASPCHCDFKASIFKPGEAESFRYVCVGKLALSPLLSGRGASHQLLRYPLVGELCRRQGCLSYSSLPTSSEAPADQQTE